MRILCVFSVGQTQKPSYAGVSDQSERSIETRTSGPGSPIAPRNRTEFLVDLSDSEILRDSGHSLFHDNGDSHL